MLLVKTTAPLRGETPPNKSFIVSSHQNGFRGESAGVCVFAGMSLQLSNTLAMCAVINEPSMLRLLRHFTAVAAGNPGRQTASGNTRSPQNQVQKHPSEQRRFKASVFQTWSWILQTASAITPRGRPPPRRVHVQAGSVLQTSLLLRATELSNIYCLVKVSVRNDDISY